MPIPKVTAECWLKNSIEKVFKHADGCEILTRYDAQRVKQELEFVLSYVRVSRAPKLRKRVREELIVCAVCYQGDEKIVTPPEEFSKNVWPGKEVSYSVGAPGIGKITYRVTRIDAKGVWAICISNNVRELEPSEVI